MILHEHVPCARPPGSVRSSHGPCLGICRAGEVPAPAGVLQIRPERFLLNAAASALLWAGAWITLGYLCADVIGFLATGAARLATPLVIVIAAAFIAYVAFKYARRYGDVVMTPAWRFLGPLEAANGTLMFGVSTAMIFAVIHRLLLARFVDLRD